GLRRVLVGESGGPYGATASRAGRSVERRGVDSETDLEMAGEGALPQQGLVRAGDDLADVGGGDIVAPEDREELREVLRGHIQDHPFLGLGDPDLPRAETLL